MDKRRTIATVLALILGIAAAALIMQRIGGAAGAPGLSSKAYFYDLNTGELFASDANRVPPIDAPSGALHGTTDAKAGVLAYVFKCDDAGHEHFIAWLETYKPETQRALMQSAQNKQHPLARTAGGMSPLVARVNPDAPGKVQWVDANTPAGAEILRGGAKPCPDGSAPIPLIPQ